MTTIAELKALLRSYGLSPRKSLGQNFLIDALALRRIVDAADLSPRDTVIEVGPGPGLLTRELLARAGRVVAIEKDSGMASLLRQEFASSSTLTIIEVDMLAVSPEQVLPAPRGPYKVVANLPYYVAAPIVRLFLEAMSKPRVMVVLLQREVGESLAAGPGNMGLLAVAVQYYAVPRLIGLIPAASFYPAPKVDSAIVRLDVREHPLVHVSPEEFFSVVKAGLGERRKQIANPLARGLGMDKAVVMGALAEASITPQRRAESLTMEEWESLCRALARAKLGA